MMSVTSFAKDDGREEALETAELARFKANVDADARRSDGLLADDLDYMHSNGDIDTKTSFIESLTSGKRDYSSMSATIQNVRFFGDVGVDPRQRQSHGRRTTASRSDLDIGYTDTWLWKDGRWQMTAWHSSRMRRRRLSRCQVRAR